MLKRLAERNIKFYDILEALENGLINQQSHKNYLASKNDLRIAFVIDTNKLVIKTVMRADYLDYVSKNHVSDTLAEII